MVCPCCKKTVWARNQSGARPTDQRKEKRATYQILARSQEGVDPQLAAKKLEGGQRRPYNSGACRKCDQGEQVLHRKTFHHPGDAFYFFDEPGIGLCSFPKSDCLGKFPCLPLNPETDFRRPYLLCSKVFLKRYPRIYSVVFFPRFDLLVEVFSFINYFIFSLTSMNFTVGMKVQLIFGIGCYWFVSVSFVIVRVVHFEVTFVVVFDLSPSSGSDSMSDFRLRLCISFNFPFSVSLRNSFHSMYFPSTLWMQCYFITNLWSSFFLRDSETK